MSLLVGGVFVFLLKHSVAIFNWLLDEKEMLCGILY